MNITIFPRKLQGNIPVIPSKSQAHRILICAAFADRPTQILCPQTNEDIEATVRCLHTLGARIDRTEAGYYVEPITAFPKSAIMDCGESGSTLRFLLPIVCALGVETTIYMHGRLPARPLSPLWEELERMGCSLSRPTHCSIHTFGKLRCGEYIIAGNVSSQFITGLLFALTILPGESKITIVGKLESTPYVYMTQDVLHRFGVKTDNFSVCGSYPFRSPSIIAVEGDWSNGAFFVVANALGSNITIQNLNFDSIQGDKEVAAIIKTDEAFPEIRAVDIPDLVPILAVYFAAKGGAKFRDCARLRLKESDRVTTVCNMLAEFGIHTEVTEHTLTVYPGQFTGATIDAAGDHRIAMAAAIAATVAKDTVTIIGAQCVAKSYPAFWQEYARLGGKYEQFLR